MPTKGELQAQNEKLTEKVRTLETSLNNARNALRQQLIKEAKTEERQDG